MERSQNKRPHRGVAVRQRERERDREGNKVDEAEIL